MAIRDKQLANSMILFLILRVAEGRKKNASYSSLGERLGHDEEEQNITDGDDESSAVPVAVALLIICKFLSILPKTQFFVKLLFFCLLK